MKNYPGVSVVITTYNEEQRLESCLKSITMQNYPQDKVEIVVIDDKSTDKTVEIAKMYTNKVFFSGKKFCEISRALGIQKASNELILFMDADNILPSKIFLENAVESILAEPNIVGSYPQRFTYVKNDPPSNRYCSLFGLNDPFQYYTNAREHLTYINGWDLLGKPEDFGKYYIIDFPKSSKLTLGAIGFLTKKSLIENKIHNNFFFHSDVYNELIQEGHTKFAITKQVITHNHCSSINIFIKKLSRNFDNFLKYGNQRKNVWAIKNRKTFIISLMKMLSIIVPLYASLRGFIRKPDIAWFLHPILCYTVIGLYSYKVIQNRIKNLL